ncbi:MAG: pyridoxamine 5'-phosphate oxidase family protein [Frankia sp.]
MGKIHTELDERLCAFIGQQPMFFVATAPSGPGGHVNVSPKGYADTFAVLSPTSVAYLDLTGSGCETAAHLRENGRITVMFCAFDGPPKIVRLYGQGRLVASTDHDFAELADRFPDRHPGARAVIVVDLDRISDSCGYSVPRLALVGERDILDQSNERKGPEKLRHYRAGKNALSIDGLPAFVPETG